MTKPDDLDDDDGSKCPVCGNYYCEKHLVIMFDDDHPYAGILSNEWAHIERQLKLRLVDAWLERRSKVDGPRSLSKLLAWFSRENRKYLLMKVSGESNPESPSDWSEEVSDELELESDDLQLEIKQVMLETLDFVDKNFHASNSYDHGPCIFSSTGIFAANPSAVQRRLKMALGLSM